MSELKDFCRQMIIKEYKRELRLFKNQVYWVLKNNPHNQYTKSAWQYMKDFNIFQSIRQRIVKHWTL